MLLEEDEPVEPVLPEVDDPLLEVVLVLPEALEPLEVLEALALEFIWKATKPCAAAAGDSLMPSCVVTEVLRIRSNLRTPSGYAMPWAWNALCTLAHWEALDELPFELEEPVEPLDPVEPAPLLLPDPVVPLVLPVLPLPVPVALEPPVEPPEVEPPVAPAPPCPPVPCEPPAD